jgi:hypothetical protein
MTLLRFRVQFVGSVAGQFGFFFEASGDRKAASLRVFHIIAADTLRQLWCLAVAFSREFTLRLEIVIFHRTSFAFNRVGIPYQSDRAIASADSLSVKASIGRSVYEKRWRM